MPINTQEKYDASTHFAFGKNWCDYSKTITDEKINDAVIELKRFLNGYDLAGKTFLDIGSGSGLHSLAALKLGVQSVTAIDIDKDSTKTTIQTLEKHAPEEHNWKALNLNIFKSDNVLQEKFDVVYSWGVLHHTGDMWHAIEEASRYVHDHGHLLIALYVQTPFCGMWKYIKWFYSKLPIFLQKPILWLYSLVRLLIMPLKGKNPIRFLKTYHKNRGMNFMHDGHDWLGGYPYESVSKDTLEKEMKMRGFTLIYDYKTQKRLAPLGTGCGEYHFIKDES